MLQNYFKIAWRNLVKNKSYSTINTVGLCLGFASCILLLGYVNFETSYENHLGNADNIYRVVAKRYANDALVYEGAKGPNRLAQIAPADIPGVDYATNTYHELCLIHTQDKKLANQRVSWVSKDFLKVFKDVLIAGNPDTALEGPLKMVLTASRAKLLFGDEDPIGKVVKLNEDLPFVVTGIVKDTPEQTHFKYGFLTSIDTFVHYGWTSKKGRWTGNDVYAYVSIKKGVSPETVNQALNQLALKHVNPKTNGGKRLAFAMQPIKNIHLTSNFVDELEINGSLNQIYILIGIGVAILFIVFINFINLSIALSLKRVKNIGVRKTLGATEHQLKVQFFLEAFLLNAIALLLSIFIVYLCLPFLEQLFQITCDFGFLLTPKFWMYALLFFIGSIILVGFYPATILSSFNPITAIRGQLTAGKSENTNVKKVLLTFQFVASIFLTIGAFVVYQQIHFMENFNLGINTEQVLAIQGPNTLNKLWSDHEGMAEKKRRYNLFKEQVIKNTAIEVMGTCLKVPGQEPRNTTDWVTLKATGERINGRIEMRYIDEGFLPTYNARFLAGENFKQQEVTTSRKEEIIINEKTSRFLGFKTPEDAIGEVVKKWKRGFVIKGVVADFHVKSLSEPISPVFFVNKHPHEFGYFVAKLHTNQIERSLEVMASKWNAIYPEDPFITFFSDDYFNQQYIKHRQFGSIFNALTFLAILIANLGLIAMVSLSTSAKLKEISIRRVIGAKVKDVLVLVSEEFIKLIAVAALIAVPVSWYFLKDWLNGFAYRINLNLIAMLVGVLLVFSIAFINIGYFVMKALRSNPSEILKED
jgi:putative ABC transport system permease protein